MIQAGLWQYATTLYRQPAAAEACLWLQDHCGVDVNMLLFALWLGADGGRSLDSQQVARVDSEVSAWRQEIVVPLRGVRRRIKTGPRPAPDPASEALRNKLKAIEVDAERIELALLERLHLHGVLTAAPAAGNLSGQALLRHNALTVVGHFCRAGAAAGNHGDEHGGMVDKLLAQAITQ